MKQYLKKNSYFIFILFAAFLASSFIPIIKPTFTIRTVVIDAGHGGKDPGCHGDKYKEKDVALAVALKLGNYIEENMKDVKVVYTRKTDVFVELQERAEIANRAKADLFICIHCNSACVRDKKLKRDVCNEEANGAETYVMGIKNEKGKLDIAKRENSAILLEDNYVKKYNGFDPNSDESYIIMSMFNDVYLTQSLSFASKVQHQYGTKTGRVDKGVKRASLWVLWRTYMPSVLTEIGFLTNPEEEHFLGSAKGQDYIASGIFRAFREYKDELEGIVKKYDDAIEIQVPYKISKEDSIELEENKKARASAVVTTSKEDPKTAPKTKEAVDTSAKEDEKEKEKEIKKEDKKDPEESKKEVKPAVVEAVKPPVIKGKEKEGKAQEKKEADTGKKEIKLPVTEAVKSPVIYKVQILSSDKKIPLNSAKFKNVEKPGEYMDKGVYKYTGGEFSTKEEAVKLQSELIKNGFKDAFVILTQDGKRITQK
jgi:N-acetylmuramoyl-L-alanine amidase